MKIFQCQECGARVRSGTTECPKCGSDDLDVAGVRDESVRPLTSLFRSNERNLGRVLTTRDDA